MVLDIHTDVVYATGQHVSALRGEAEELVSALLTDIDTASAEVVHPVVSEALASYHAEWMSPAGFTLVAEIQDAGDSTSTSAVIADESDLAAEADLTAPAGPST